MGNSTDINDAIKQTKSVTSCSVPAYSIYEATSDIASTKSKEMLGLFFAFRATPERPFINHLILIPIRLSLNYAGIYCSE